jgi:hypothetical protein
MAFKLTRAEEARREALLEKMTQARDTLDEVTSAQLGVIEDAYAVINEAFSPYNEVVEEIRGFVEDIASERESEFDDKSERWQESDRGEAARDWISQWQDAADCDIDVLHELTVEVPVIEIPAVGEVLENLPSEMEP